jgi:lipoprotein-anchoring transpeptidase ErfK/SrfK
MRLVPTSLLIAGGVLVLAACSDPAPDKAAAQSPPPAIAQAAPPPSAPVPLQIADPAPLTVPLVPDAAAPASPVAAAINEATWPPADPSAKARRAALIRAEVLLARARFSPGVIDGEDGGNLGNAVAAFEAAHGLPVDGKINAQVWTALAQADPGPAVVAYVVTPEDVKGPFVEKIPTKFEDMAKLDHLGFTGPLEALAEKFHMDEALLTALNPGADFAKPGTRLLVVASGPETLPAPVAAIEVDKNARQVRAYGADGGLLATYPATVGSTERPAPTGTFTVEGVARNPTYTYDPKRLTFGDKSMGKLTIKPGPNNPVGAVWIDLSIPTYGIHGAPDPRLVGKTASHGCVRLTNWDVRQLASGVKKGAQVTFVGAERPAGQKGKLNSASAGSPPLPG